MTPYDKTLYEDALNLSIDKSLADVATLLQWAQNTGRLSEKIAHVEHAIQLLAQVRDNYRSMREDL